MRPAYLVPFCAFALVQGAAPAPDAAALLPALQGWTTPEAPRRFGPENLYEHINGAADGFLDCDFQELVTQVYEAPGGRSLTVELYRHADPDAAFGMYSQERPAAGTFLSIGAEGYHETGILNFLKGAWYVKLSGFGLGTRDREPLESAARAIAARIPGPAALPGLLRAFPKEGMMAGSLRHFRRNVLGYAFLERGFSAEYFRDGKRVSLWVFAPSSPARGREMMVKYLQAVGRPAPTGPAQAVSFTDPHHGPVSLLLSGPHLVAAVGGDASQHGRMLEGLRAGLGPR